MGDTIQQAKPGYTHSEKNVSHGDELPATTTPEVTGFVSIDSELPKGYYRSSYFLGTYLATTLSQTSGSGTYVMSAAIIGQMNADIGPSQNIVWVFIGKTCFVEIRTFSRGFAYFIGFAVREYCSNSQDP